MSAQQVDFIAASTTIDRPALTPEIALYLASEVTPLWHATADSLVHAGVEPPFWAFAWPGGQALARHVMDNAAIVAGHRVLDIAAGSGLVAIAAAMAGAASVTANDIDPLSLAAVALNAKLNGVTVTTSGDDLTRVPFPEDGPREWDVILAGDVFYDREMAARFAPWLGARAAAGALVLIGDPSRPYLPSENLKRLKTYNVTTSLDLESATKMATTIWRVGA
jgi:predicted nicotinamide N-methyase